MITQVGRRYEACVPNSDERSRSAHPHRDLASDSAESRESLWSRYTACPSRRLRDDLFERYRYLVYGVLKRVGCRGDEDLEQVGLLGLLKAVDRFDPGHGCRFASFAVPTIVGEIKRYLRDQSRLVRPTRSILDLRHQVMTREAEMVARNGRSPTLADLAGSLGVDLDQVVDAMAMEEMCHPRSLDGLMQSTDSSAPASLEECLGEDDPELTKVENRIACRQAIRTLEPRLKEVVRLRYYDNLTQQETARRLGISQMHVSRLERRALAELRGQMDPAWDTLKGD